MQANPEKFLAISIGKKTHTQNIVLNLNGFNIKCDDEVKLFGVTIDFKLDFNTHISNIWKKAARQLNVLKRIGTHLTRLSKPQTSATVLLHGTSAVNKTQRK